MLDEELIERGSQAEQSQEYVASLIERSKGHIFDNIMALAPNQTELFTVFKSQIVYLDNVLATVAADIRDGQKAIERIQGTAEVTNTGIL